jgi:N-acyl-L-homoserine lactone synthetase
VKPDHGLCHPEGETIRVEMADTPEVLCEAQRLRHQVFCLERGVFASDSGRTIECDEFDHRSRHIVVRRCDDGEVIATARVVAGSFDRWTDCLPMQRYCCPSLFRGLPMDRLGEISRFAISKRSRGQACAPGPLLRLALLHGILRASQDAGLTHWCALMEPSLVRLLYATGVQFAPLGPMVDAYGRRQPCIAEIDLTLASGKLRRPDFYALVAHERFRPGVIPEKKTRLESSRAA